VGKKVQSGDPPFSGDLKGRFVFSRITPENSPLRVADKTEKEQSGDYFPNSMRGDDGRCHKISQHSRGENAEMLQ
jgi:hypothetical protein